MGSASVEYELVHQDRRCGARLGILKTPHGSVDCPGFMPVGTLGTVKGLTCEMLRQTGAQMILSNTYHLALRPGMEVIDAIGGLHRFMGWDGPILTDSGGFQIFSLSRLNRITEEGVTFRSHIDGNAMELTPERAVEIQETLGSDIAMVLDQVPPLPGNPEEIRDACHRSIRWAKRCRDFASRPDQSLFAIVQGGLDAGLRKECAKELVELDFPGYAIGGLSVGEPPAQMYETLDVTCPFLPHDRPRYLMGVGRPQDLLQSIGRGVDLFDCVMPTRNGRNALAFTDDGPLKMRNQVHRFDSRPIQDGLDTPWGGLSRAYLRHLFIAGEMLGPILLSFHNLAYYQRLLADAREAIRTDSFCEFFVSKMSGWGAPIETPETLPFLSERS